MKKKIICTVTNDLSQDQRMHRICNTLANNGYNVLLVGRLKRDSQDIHQEFSFENHRIDMFFEEGMAFYFEYNFRLFFFLLFSKFDIVNSVDTDTLVPGRLTSLLKRKKFVFDAHEIFDKVPELEGKRLKAKVWNFVERLFLIGSKYNYTVNESLRSILSKRHDLTFNAFYNFPERSIVNEVQLSFGTTELVYQGMLNKGRGLPEIIHAVSQIENVRLNIIGSGVLEESLKELVDTLDDTERVKFWGFVSGEELTKMTSRFHIGINLLDINSESYRYSSANKFFDYTMAGLPSINMDFPEYTKFNNQFNIAELISDLKPVSITRAIEKLHPKSEKYQQLKSNCTKAREQWNWEKEEKRLVEFYKSIT